jgi:hypothetical protein
VSNQRVICQGQGENRGDAGMAGGHDITEQSHLMISMAHIHFLLFKTEEKVENNSCSGSRLKPCQRL